MTSSLDYQNGMPPSRESPILKKYPHMLVRYLEGSSDRNTYPNVEDVIRRHCLPPSAPICHSVNFSLVCAVAVLPFHSSGEQARVNTGFTSNWVLSSDAIALKGVGRRSEKVCDRIRPAARDRQAMLKKIIKKISPRIVGLC